MSEVLHKAQASAGRKGGAVWQARQCQTVNTLGRQAGTGLCWDRTLVTPSNSCCLVHAASPHRCLQGQQLVHGERKGEQHWPCCALVLLEVVLQAVI